LRVIQERQVLRLGEAVPVQIDVRFVAATQRPLAAEVSAGRFRADLRARLEGGVLALPALRKRRDEIAPLFMQFLKRALSRETPVVDPRLIEALCVADWPLNVRELSLLAQRLAVLHASRSTWTLADLQSDLPVSDKKLQVPTSTPKSIRETQEEKEAARVLEALHRNAGNLSRTATELKISRQRAYRLLKLAREREP
jgi:DNA-binding NtrC family response regulator